MYSIRHKRPKKSVSRQTMLFYTFNSIKSSHVKGNIDGKKDFDLHTKQA